MKVKVGVHGANGDISYITVGMSDDELVADGDKLHQVTWVLFIFLYMDVI